MKIAVIYPDCCAESAKKLAKVLGAKAVNSGYVHGYDLIFSYGLGVTTNGNMKRINSAFGINRCVNKYETLCALKNAKIPCLEYTISRDIARKSWNNDWVAVRHVVDGNKNDGMEWWHYQYYTPLPKAPLYTRWYEHKKEYRIVVFNGKVVGRYEKQYDSEGTWWFMPVSLKTMDDTSVQAAKVLGVDYVGFDILYNNKNDFRICEANSGPILTDEVAQAIKKELLK